MTDKPKMGRPRVELEQHQLEALCRLNPTLKDCAAYFRCSQDTIERRSKEFGYETFAYLRDKNMVHTRLSLIRTAVKQAENGNTAMLIFSLKNLCKWADKNEDTISTTEPTKLIIEMGDSK